MDSDDEYKRMNDDGDEEEEDIDDILTLAVDKNIELYNSLKDCVIFLVDCSELMHISNRDINPISTILGVAENFLKTKIITNEKDYFSLILYNTEKCNNEPKFEGVDVMYNPDNPDAELIKRLKQLSELTDPKINPNDYEKQLNENFQPNHEKTKNYIGNALWICQSLFKDFDANRFTRRVFIFTNEDTPFKEETNDKTIAVQRAKDMVEEGIILELFPMKLEGVFNMDNFYANIIVVNPEEEEELGDSNLHQIVSLEMAEDRLKELTKRIRQKEMKKRTIGRCPFYLTDNYRFYVKLYSNINTSITPKSYKIDARTNQLLERVVNYTDEETGKPLKEEEIGTCQYWKGKKYKFTKENMEKIKNVGTEPAITLLGFKSMDLIKPYHNLRESIFIFPDEYYSENSGIVCDALIKQMIAKRKVAIVKYYPRAGAILKIAALYPQRESFDEDFFQTPQGFNMVILPFGENITSNQDILEDLPEVDLPTPEQSEAAKTLIKRMDFNFDCRNFEDFYIQSFYSNLQSIALREDHAEKTEDLLEPKTEEVKKLIKGADVKFAELFPIEEPKPKKKAKGKKTKDDQSQDDDGKKKNKELTEEDIKKAIKDGKLKKFTFVQLKEFCTKKDINIKKKKKADLMDELEKIYSSKDD
ncbi:MAG: hypothetical protein MJ252_10705 [archaeon]|nr:hypothetical protein [archaeon]